MAGRLIAGRYRLEQWLGAGGMGVVWRATDVELRRTVAVKRSHTTDPAQIWREAQIGARLTHPNVVTVYDVVVDEDECWLVMEYLPARGLDELLAADGPLPPDQVRRIGTGLAGALAAMHADGVVHRDIKPGNVLIAEDGTAKLTDLGIARWSEATVTGGAYLAGTQGFLAPEVANGQEATPAADIFSLGATLFAAATGRSPWGEPGSGPFVQALRAASYERESVSAAGELAAALDVLMRERPEQRPTAHRAQQVLAGPANEDATVTGHNASRGGAATRSQLVRRWIPRWRRRWKRPALAVGAAATVAVILVGLAVSTRNHTRSATEPAGTLGDPRTADPCALLVPGSLARFGTVSLEPNYGNFNHCDLLVTTADTSGPIDVALEFQLPDQYPAQPPKRGRLGPTQDDPPTENRCQRTITLPNLYRVVIFARQVADHPAPLCGAADAVALAAYGILAQGPVPHRSAFPASSTGSIDACSLLSGPDLAGAIGAAATADPDYGRWTCYWEHGGKQVTITFGREWPLEDDPPDGTRIELDGRTAYVETTSNNGHRDECDVTVVHRRYTPATPSPKDTPRQREETVVVGLQKEGTDAGPSQCSGAERLARGVIRRLSH